jgi:hypothetical protein
MKLLLTVLLAVLILTGTAHAWPDRFDTYDYIGQAATAGAISLDWMQTYQIARHPNEWSETYSRQTSISREGQHVLCSV